MTTFTWDVARGLPELLATSDGTRYLHGLELLGVQQGGVWRYPHSDALGSIRGWTDPAGALVGSASFSPFGVPRAGAGFGAAPGCQFTGVNVPPI